MGWPEVADKALALVTPYVPWAFGLLFLWLVVIITDRSFKGTFLDIAREFSSAQQREWNLRSINLVGGICLVPVTIFLFFGGLAHIDVKHTTHTDVWTKAIYLGVVVVIGLYFILCVTLTRKAESD